nr:DUF4192 domain-containing protein [Streptomyces sp. ERV7]
MNKHRASHGSHGLPDDDPQLTLRNPAELADALPYLMGFHPTDSIVMVALHGRRGRFGGRLRLGIPRAPGEWPHVAEQLAECLVAGSERRGPRPDGIIVFLCQDPDLTGEVTSSQVMETLRPLAQLLRTACGALDVPVLEALCISDGRYWSYCCPDARCCPPEGNVLALPGTSVLAAAATFAGLQVRGSLREMEARLIPWRRPAAADQERVLAAAEEALVPRILDEEERLRVGRETLDLAGCLMRRLSGAPPAVGRPDADALDDGLIAHDEAAALLLGLQDRTTRDRAAEWMEGPDAAPALRLWRALARRGAASAASPPVTAARSRARRGACGEGAGRVVDTGTYGDRRCHFPWRGGAESPRTPPGRASGPPDAPGSAGGALARGRLWSGEHHVAHRTRGVSDAADGQGRRRRLAEPARRGGAGRPDRPPRRRGRPRRRAGEPQAGPGAGHPDAVGRRADGRLRPGARPGRCRGRGPLPRRRGGPPRMAAPGPRAPSGRLDGLPGPHAVRRGLRTAARRAADQREGRRREPGGARVERLLHRLPLVVRDDPPPQHGPPDDGGRAGGAAAGAVRGRPRRAHPAGPQRRLPGPLGLHRDGRHRLADLGRGRPLVPPGPVAAAPGRR